MTDRSPSFTQGQVGENVAQVKQFNRFKHRHQLDVRPCTY